MTAKTWYAISKAVEMIKTAQNTSVDRAQAWLIATCAAGNIRSRIPSFADSELPLNRNGLLSTDHLRSGSRPVIISRRRAPVPVSPAAWKSAVIDGDVLVANHGRWFGIEISIADLEFDLKGSLAPSGTASAIPQTRGPRSDKEAIIAEAQRRVTADESIPPTLSAFARELHFWGSRGFFAEPKLGRRHGSVLRSGHEPTRPE
jgi:hypothetical protein